MLKQENVLQVSIAVSATVTDPTDDVKAMSPERRKCLLESETSNSLYKVRQNFPELYPNFSWQAIFFSKYTKSSCQLENNIKNLLDKFKYDGIPFQTHAHANHLKMFALLLTKSTRLCDQEVCSRVQKRKRNCLQVTPRLSTRPLPD